MGFQTANSKSTGSRPAVKLITAGVDQVEICGVFIQLEAIVDDPLKLIGHTILWEQLSGIPAILSNPNILNPSFPINENSDKIFRVWIDKGTSSAQFDDVSIFFTPTSLIAITNTPNNQRDGFIGIIPDPVHCDDILDRVAPPPPTTLDGQEPTPGTFAHLDWSHPRRIHKHANITSYDVVLNGTIVDNIASPPGLEQGPPSIDLEYDGSSGVYRIDTNYLIQDKQYTFPSCEKVIPNGVPDPIIVLNSAIGVTYDTQKQSHVDITRNVFTVISGNNSNHTGGMGSNAENFAFTRTNFIFNIIEPPLTISSFSGGMGNNPTNITINITRVDPQGIGG